MILLIIFIFIVLLYFMSSSFLYFYEGKEIIIGIMGFILFISIIFLLIFSTKYGNLSIIELLEIN
jgi:hypothetical protein